LAVIGLILRSWAYLELGDLFTWHISVQNEQKVVDTGPYRMVAHPGYSGALLTYTATGIMFQAWWATLASFLILFFVFKRRIEFEEKLLLGELGEDYRGFLHKRHKLLPPLY
jgi:protein-S-isoprenylcysteine O-methyltransferase Ste14